MAVTLLLLSHTRLLEVITARNLLTFRRGIVMPTISSLRGASFRCEQRWVRQARAASHLTDLTPLAREDELDVRVYVSQRLFSAILRTYPSAGLRDCLSAERLVRWVGEPALRQPPRREPVLLLRPPALPYWVSEYFVLRVRRIYSRRRVWAVVIMAHDETLHRLPQQSPSSLPATLLMRLSLALHNLRQVARPCDGKSLDRMQCVVSQLVGMSPLKSDIERMTQQPDTGPPVEFTRTRYRLLMLNTLVELTRLAEVAAAETPMNQLVRKFSCRLHVLRSRLAEMTIVIESALRLAYDIPWRPCQGAPTPFETLLVAYVSMQKALSAGRTTVSSEVLSLVRKQLHDLQDLVHDRDQKELFYLKARFKRLGGGSREQGIVSLPPKNPIVVQ